MIRFDTSTHTTQLARKVVDRFAELCMKLDIEPEDTPSEQDMAMDLMALCASYPTADLNVLLESSDFDFAHDVSGITRHMDRDDNSPTGGKLLRCFYPRFMRGNRALEHNGNDATREIETTEWLRNNPNAEASDGGRLG